MTANFDRVAEKYAVIAMKFLPGELGDICIRVAGGIAAVGIGAILGYHHQKGIPIPDNQEFWHKFGPTIGRAAVGATQGLVTGDSFPFPMSIGFAAGGAIETGTLTAAGYGVGRLTAIVESYYTN